MRTVLLAITLGAGALSAYGQSKEVYKFEKINPEMLRQRLYPVDSGATAVILADVGETEIEGNAKGFFSFVFTRHKRVHILGKGGYDEATFALPLYHQVHDAEEKLESIRATSYNLENGQVVETRLSKDNIFTEKFSKNVDIKKFTLPSVKEGTIIDIEYKIASDYLYTLQPWDFQGSTPRLWSEYRLSLPQFLDYMFIYKGYVPFYINEKKDRQQQFSVIQPNQFERSDYYKFTAGITDYRWVTKNVPGFKPEAYISSPQNFMSHIDFQLSGYREPLTIKDLVPTWPQQARELLQSESFGQKLDKNNGYLSDVMRTLTRSTKEATARAVFTYVRDNFTCDGQQGLYLHSSVKDVFKNRKGSVAELNLLLVTMLRYADIDADPLMLSTRSNGTVFTTYPMLSRFNYIIATAEIDGQKVYLDASKPRLGFNRLSTECYNGMARAINNEATPVVFATDSLRETQMINVFLGNPDKKGWTGTFQQVAGYYESYRLRQEAAEKGSNTLGADLKKTLGSSVTVEKVVVDSMDRLDGSLALRADLSMELSGDDIIYVNPMMGFGLRSNPFISPERSYPVEMPYCMDDLYNFTFYVPDGYVVDELPKSIRMKLNDNNDGAFEFLISNSDGVISMRSRIRLNRANYLPDEYEMLREFFSRIAAKHNEQIVLKKKK
ncbi:DUF3857 domain-containing protein [Flaviaesturariibacter flavus]|uniref:DUF3857 domain-containing protein n=1 Tax=Flaviaesturariibacter flavus TaxID=2502780 RepID=A0A4R1B7E5_9BACT|nr:DUF3857 domain-containing protein [Flaviaesturariibacter flavus]TCJ12448.1 DUF3857 domain-containing protein [Flaviaesturariibacter flavus]